MLLKNCTILIALWVLVGCAGKPSGKLVTIENDTNFDWAAFSHSSVAVISKLGATLTENKMYGRAMKDDSLLFRKTVFSIENELQKHSVSLYRKDELLLGSTGKISINRYAEEGVEYLLYVSQVDLLTAERETQSYASSFVVDTVTVYGLRVEFDVYNTQSKQSLFKGRSVYLLIRSGEEGYGGTSDNLFDDFSAHLVSATLLN